VARTNSGQQKQPKPKKKRGKSQPKTGKRGHASGRPSSWSHRGQSGI
jgi:hypothetical protein